MAEPAQLGPFELGDPIGRGGMGTVVRAEHVRTGVEVAVKVIRESMTPDRRRHFRREIRAHAARRAER